MLRKSSSETCSRNVLGVTYCELLVTFFSLQIHKVLELNTCKCSITYETSEFTSTVRLLLSVDFIPYSKCSGLTSVDNNTSLSLWSVESKLPALSQYH